MWSPFSSRYTHPRAAVRRLRQPRLSDPAAIDLIRRQILEIKTVMASGVEGAGYGDKRTDFRSFEELRQILNGLEEELDELLGIGGRVRQIRMTTQWDKGL